MRRNNRHASHSRPNDRTIRDNAGDLREKVIRMLGVTILVSWGMFFARVSHAADGPGVVSVGSPPPVCACAAGLIPVGEPSTRLGRPLVRRV